MFGYIVRRLLSAALVVFLTSIVVFALFFYGPSNPGQSLCDQTGRCTAERAAAINESLGFNDPVVGQYGAYVKGIVQGREIAFGGSSIDCPAPCFGISYLTRQPVSETLARAFPATVSLALGSAVIFFPVGVLLGTLAARRRGTATDRVMVGTSLVMSSIPYYLLALMLFLYLVVIYAVVPRPGYTPITENPWAWFTGLLVPWVVLGLYNSTAYARFSRGSMVDALSEDYVRTAKAKGLVERRVVVRHALRAAIVPVVTIFGLDLAGLLAGTVFTEQVFQINGIGREAIEAIRNQDFPIISATVLLAATLVVIANVVVDITYSFIDPRVRLT
jgi:peptide/nickel transport system permease protein